MYFESTLITTNYRDLAILECTKMFRAHKSGECVLLLTKAYYSYSEGGCFT